MAGGRPSIYSQELAATICERLIHGEGLRAICRDDAMPSISTVIDWIKDKQEFSAQYARARELQAEQFGNCLCCHGWICWRRDIER